MHREMFDDWAHREGWKETKRAKNSAVPISNTPKVIPSEGIAPRLGDRRDAEAKRPAKANANTAKT